MQCGGLSSEQWRVIISNVEGYHHESGGCGVSWRDIISISQGANTVEGYYQYSGGCQYNVEGNHQYNGGLSSLTQRDIIMKVENAEYRGRLSSVQWMAIICNVEGYLQYSGGCQCNVEGSHHDSERCGVSWRVIISIMEGQHLKRGGLSSVQWKVIICGVEGYHHESGGCGLFQTDFLSL